MIGMIKRAWEFTRPQAGWLAIFAGFSVGCLFLGFYFSVASSHAPSVLQLDNHLLNNTVKEGGILKLYVDAKHQQNFNCLGIIIREYSRYTEFDGQRIRETVRSAPSAAPIIRGHEKGYIVDIPLPSDVTAGRWDYLEEKIYNCGLDGIKRYRSPDNMSFVVLPK